MSDFSDIQYKAAISFSSSGDNELVAAPSAGRIVVDHIHAIPESATALILKSDSTALTGTENYDAQQAFVIENTGNWYNGVYQCAAEEALNLNSSNAVDVNGYIIYRVLDAF